MRREHGEDGEDKHGQEEKDAHGDLSSCLYCQYKREEKEEGSMCVVVMDGVNLSKFPGIWGAAIGNFNIRFGLHTHTNTSKYPQPTFNFFCERGPLLTRSDKSKLLKSAISTLPT